MGQASLAVGAPLRALHAVAGVGLAFPLWDAGALDLNAAWLHFAGLSLMAGGSGAGDFSLTARYTWYHEDATLRGRFVGLDHWSVTFSWYY